MNFTFFLEPLSIQKGETDPGKTPKYSNNLSSDPKDKCSHLTISLSFFKSMFLSCSQVIKKFCFFLSLKYKFLI